MEANLVKKLASVSLAALCAAPAFAEQQIAAGADASHLQEIIVTAQRRNENQQTVPIAVTSLNATDLSNAGAADALDLNQAVSGLNIQQSGGDTQIKLRGIGTENQGVGDEASVAVYVDGAYQPFGKGDVFHFNDIERVEVLKGPQGTLFGRNATGGLINFITRTPSLTATEGSFSASYSRFNTAELNGYVSGPLSSTLAAHVAGYYTRSDGFISDPNKPGVHVSKNHGYGVRGKLLWKPSDSARFVLSVDASYLSDPSSFLATVVDRSSPFDALGSATPPNIIPSRPYQATMGVLEPIQTTKNYGAALESTIDLGGVDLISISSARKTENHLRIEADRTPFDAVRVDVVAPSTYASEDLRLQSNDKASPFQWTLGVNGFLSRQRWEDFTVILNPIVTGLAAPVVQQLVQFKVDTRAFAIYGQGSYDLNDQLTAILGMRYSTEHKSALITSAQTGVLSAYPTVRGKATFNDFSPKFTLQYKFDPKTMVYASYGRGFKSGLFNPLQISFIDPSGTPRPEKAGEVIQPEKIAAWELGLKSDFLDRFRANISAFYYRYRNIQVELIIPSGTGTLIENAARATIKGVDGDFYAVFPNLFSSSDSLSLKATVAYLDARYDSYPSAGAFIYPGSGQGLAATAVDASGNRMTRSPKWTQSINASYSTDTNLGRFSLVGNVYHSGRFFYDAPNTPRYGQSAFTKVNVSLGWESVDGHLGASIWGKNITDEVTAQAPYLSGLGLFKRYYAPATYGATVRYGF